MIPVAWSRPTGRLTLPIGWAIHNGQELREGRGVTEPRVVAGWVELEEASIGNPGAARDDRSTEDPVTAVAVLMQWLLARGKTPMVRPAQLAEVVTLAARLLDAIDVRPVTGSDLSERVTALSAVNTAPETILVGDGTLQADGQRPEFSGAEWDAFGHALSRGEFDAAAAHPRFGVT